MESKTEETVHPTHRFSIKPVLFSKLSFFAYRNYLQQGDRDCSFICVTQHQHPCLIVSVFFIQKTHFTELSRATYLLGLGTFFQSAQYMLQ